MTPIRRLAGAHLTWLAAMALLLAPVSVLARSAEIVCETPQLRIPTTVSLAAPVNGDFNLVGGGQLAWIDVLWLADEQTDRLREYVTVDWRDESLSAVQVYDVAVGSEVEDEVAPTRLVPTSDFASGRVDFDFCMPWDATHGLAVAYYEMGYDDDGKPRLTGAVTAFETETRPTYFAATNRTGRWFDVGFSYESVFSTGQTSDRMLDMIEGATGATPPLYLGGSLVIEATALRDVEPVRFISAQDGFMAGDTFTITGPNPSVLASHWVTSVQYEGREQLTSDGLLRDLSPSTSPLTVILGEEVGADRFLLHVVDGRLDISHEPSSCLDGAVSGVIEGESNGNPLETGLRYFRGLSQGFASIAGGQFEATGLSCPPNTDQTLVTFRGTLGDSVRLATDARAGDGSQAQLCATYLGVAGTECSPLSLASVLRLFDTNVLALSGGERFALNCRDTRGAVDSIDAFIESLDQLSLSQQREIREALRAGEGTLMDSDGDGSVCNAREQLSRDRVLTRLDVWVTPAL